MAKLGVPHVDCGDSLVGMSSVPAGQAGVKIRAKLRKGMETRFVSYPSGLWPLF